MSNPYAAFNVSDDEEQVKATVTKTSEKPHRTHQDRKNQKKQKEQASKKVESKPAAEESIPQKQKDPMFNPRKEREKKDRYREKTFKDSETNKHYLDRRSGTGREDRPRKAGGYNNPGNVKEEQNEEKPVKEEGEETTPVVAEGEAPFEAPQQPEKPTLDEYYKSKGIEIEYKPDVKVAKKGEVKAEWIKKEKLTLMETKEDKKNQQKAVGQQVVQQSEMKVGLDIEEENLGMLGFGKKVSQPKPEEPQRGDRKGGRKAKPQFTADDFPSL